MNYRTEDVDVRGGGMRVGIWESPGLAPDEAAEHTVLAIHGVTSSNLAWELVARRLTGRPGVRVVAPDLRGRGRSADLPGPWGMEQHAQDMAAVANRFGPVQVTVGHSMGGTVTLVSGHLYPGTFGRLILVDGGVPLPKPEGMSVEDFMAAVLGPTLDRLSMTFADHEEYRRFWQERPAFAGQWSPEMDAYADYDLVRGQDGLLRSSSRYDAVVDDSQPQPVIQAAWDAMTEPPLFLRAPRGLQDESPGVHSPALLERFTAEHPVFRWTEAEDTNHYTIVLGERGADLVTASIIERMNSFEKTSS